MSVERARWIEAAKLLALTPSAKVACPRCSSAELEVFDAVMPDGGVERHLRCPACGAYQAILRPEVPCPPSG